MTGRRNMFSTIHKRKTYYVEKNLNPEWSNQSFIFDVPKEAVEEQRCLGYGYSVRVRIRNFSFMKPHQFLGQTDVHLRSLRNQQELIGWYPLTGKAAGGFQNMSSDQVCGSVKLRVQWIYTIPALLDYCLHVSSQKLQELTSASTGMEKQLASLKALQKKKHKLTEPSNFLPLSSINYLKFGKSKKYPSAHPPSKTIGNLMNEVRSTIATVNTEISTPWKNLRRRTNMQGTDDDSNRWNLQRSVKVAREVCVSAIKFETAESRRRRGAASSILESPTTSLGRHARFVNSEPGIETSSRGVLSSLAEESLRCIQEANEKSPGRQRLLSNDHVMNILEENRQSIRDLSSLRDGSCKSLLGTSSHSLLEASRQGLLEGSRQNLNEIFSPFSHGSRKSYRRHSRDHHSIDGSESESIMFELSSTTAAANMEKDSINNTITSFDISACNRVLSVTDNDAQRNVEIGILFDQGFLYHEHGNYCHRHHLTRRIRSEIALATGVKSGVISKLPSNIRQLKSWTEAQLYLNDESMARKLGIPYEKAKDAGDDVNNVDIERKPTACHTKTFDDINKTKRNDCPGFDIVWQALKIPSQAPSIMQEYVKASAYELAKSRHSFSKAAKRSHSAVINPGGMLTIRPITALHLPTTNNGMYVKLSYGYGSVNTRTRTVDARVSPTWTKEDDIVQDSASDNLDKGILPTFKALSHRKLQSHDSNLEPDPNDLQVYVKPFETSGSLSLSVMEERLQSDIELGVVHIPLGSALSCCNECIEDYRELKGLRGSNLLSMDEHPMYIRWFPLMNPKDCIAVDGDMGRGGRPPESEKEKDDHFTQFYQPCIKLALIWQPDISPNHADVDDSTENEHESVANGTNEQQENSENATTYFHAYMGSISASLIDSYRAKDLLSFTWTDFDLRCSVIKARTRLGLAIGWLQLDHQDHDAREPVVVSPTPLQSNPQPTVQILAIKDNLRSKNNLDSYEYIAIILQELDVRVEEAWLFNLWEFYMSLIKRREAQKKTIDKRDNVDIIHSSFVSGPVDENTNKNCKTSRKGDKELKKVYIERLILDTFKMNLSYIKSAKGSRSNNAATVPPSDSNAEKGINNYNQSTGQNTPNANTNTSHYKQDIQSKELFRRWSEHTSDEELWVEGDGKFSHGLPRIISAVLPSITNAPVRLHGKAIEHVFETMDEIFASLKNYYVNETLRQIYKIIGSVDFVGNPTMVLSSLFTGIQDFFLEPSIALLKSPKNPSRLGLGVARGTLSLVSHSTSGIFGLAARLSASAGKAAATLSLDNEFQQRHAKQLTAYAKAKRPRSKTKRVMIFVGRPINDILFGAMGALTGLLYEPYRGGKKDGATGLAKGVGVGVVGLVAKPIAGVFDAFSHVTESIHDVAKSVNIAEKKIEPVRKRRLPYVFGMNNILMPYDSIQARSIELLKIKSLLMDDEYLVHSEVLRMKPGLDVYVVITTKKMVIFNLKRERGGLVKPQLCWKVNFSYVAMSNLESKGHNGVVLYIALSDFDPNNKLKYPKEYKRLSDTESKPSTRYENESTSYHGQVKDSSHREGAYNPASVRSINSVRMASSFGESIEDGVDIVESPSKWGNWEASKEKIESRTPQQPRITMTSDQFHQPYWNDEEGNDKETLEGYAVIGEFHHRPQLARLHNAICCLTGNFDSLINDRTLGPEGSNEGRSVFGTMQFYSSIVTSLSEHNTEAGFYSILEEIPWKNGSLQTFNNANMKYLLQTQRQHDKDTEERNSEKQLKGLQKHLVPRWLLEARARADVVSPRNSRHGDDKYTLVDQEYSTKGEYKKDLIYSNIIKPDNNGRETIRDADQPFHSLISLDKEQEDAEEDQKIMNKEMTQHGRSISVPDVVIQDDTYSSIGTSETVLQRLTNVELMLERLLQNQILMQRADSTSMSTMSQETRTIITRSTTGDGIGLDHNADANSHQETTDKLIQEIEFLKATLKEKTGESFTVPYDHVAEVDVKRPTLEVETTKTAIGIKNQSHPSALETEDINEMEDFKINVKKKRGKLARLFSGSRKARRKKAN